MGTVGWIIILGLVVLGLVWFLRRKPQPSTVQARTRAQQDAIPMPPELLGEATAFQTAVDTAMEPLTAARTAYALVPQGQDSSIELDRLEQAEAAVEALLEAREAKLRQAIVGARSSLDTFSRTSSANSPQTLRAKAILRFLLQRIQEVLAARGQLNEGPWGRASKAYFGTEPRPTKESPLGEAYWSGKEKNEELKGLQASFKRELDLLD